MALHVDIIFERHRWLWPQQCRTGEGLKDMAGTKNMCTGNREKWINGNITLCIEIQIFHSKSKQK